MTVDTFLTITQMAELFHTTETALYARIHRTRQGRDNFILPIAGLGKRHLWLREEVERHINRCAAATTQKSKTKPESIATLAKHGIGVK